MSLFGLPLSTSRFSPSDSSGFTILELMVSVAIFVFMTALLVAKYGNFNSGVLFTDQAYDVALAVRTAQTYGLGVAEQGSVQATAFDSPYGVDFSTAASPANITLTTFADDYAPIPETPPDHIYTAGQDSSVSTYTLTRGTFVSGLCTGTQADCASNPTTQLDVSFKRPNPDAYISPCPASGACNYAQITLTNSSGDVRIISVQQNGEISVQ